MRINPARPPGAATSASPAARRGRFAARLITATSGPAGSNRTSTVFSTPLTFSDRLKTKRWGAQLDLGYRPNDNLEFGVTGGYQHSKSDLQDREAT